MCNENQLDKIYFKIITKIWKQNSISEILFIKQNNLAQIRPILTLNIKLRVIS